jgi:hypothetical protein
VRDLGIFVKIGMRSVGKVATKSAGIQLQEKGREAGDQEGTRDTRLNGHFRIILAGVCRLFKTAEQGTVFV